MFVCYGRVGSHMSCQEKGIPDIAKSGYPSFLSWDAVYHDRYGLDLFIQFYFQWSFYYHSFPLSRVGSLYDDYFL